MSKKITNINIASFISILLSLFVLLSLNVYIFDSPQQMVDGLSLLYIIWAILFSVIIWNILCKIISHTKTKYTQFVGIFFIYLGFLCILPHSFSYYFSGGYIIFRSIDKVIEAPVTKVSLTNGLADVSQEVTYFLFFGRYSYIDHIKIKNKNDILNHPYTLEYALLNHDYSTFIKRYQIAEFTGNLMGDSSVIPDLLSMSVRDMDKDYRLQNPYGNDNPITYNIYNYYINKGY